MNVGKKKFILTPEDEERSQKGVSKIVQSKSKINRLRRSPKASPTQSKVQLKSDSTNCTSETDFKTPTRVSQSRFRTPSAVESPSNESEFQHDIIWDPTSPVTPIRNGRGRRKTAQFKLVDISDLVSRIAPQSRRPEEAESSLLQWIGDTAVPCTPEVREAKTKPKSTRQNPVDDLLRLAKQFDFNMIHQEEAHLQPRPQRSEATMDEDQELFFNEDDPPAQPCQDSEAVEPKTNSDDPMDDLAFDLGTQDDLDLLFDGSTQCVSGALSQGLSALSQGAAKIGSDVSGQVGARINLSGGTTDRGSTLGRLSRAKGTGSATVRIAAQEVGNVCSTDDFDDDWNDDDLLENSLVMEMTQNPELFSAPRYSSTQSGVRTTQNKGYHVLKDAASSTNGADHRQVFSEETYGTTRGQNQSFRGWQSVDQRSRPAGNGNNIQSAVPEKSNQPRKVFPSSDVLSAVPVSSKSNPKQISAYKAIYQPKETIKTQKTLETIGAGSACRVQPATKTSLISNSGSSTSVQPGFRLNKDINFTDEKENRPATELDDIANEDLDCIFASDDIWDEGADDDDLFCEACEKAEEFMTEPDPVLKPSTDNNTTTQNKSFAASTGANVTAKANKPIHGGRIATRTGTSFSPQKQVVSKAGPDNYPSAAGGNTVKDGGMRASSSSSEGRYKFTRVNSSSATSSAACMDKKASATSHQSASRIPDHQFGMPYSTFNAAPAYNKDVGKAVVGKCSDAEIERKKQQAMERRRLRMLASQNL